MGFIALGVGIASFAMNFWIPFMPLYMLELGAGSDAGALFWMGIASTGSGIARLLTGPIWGIIADRYGRKLMYVRALYCTGAIGIVAAVATEPWHIVVVWTIMGVVSGFSPAAVALASVVVPQSRLMGSLGTIQGTQYAGMTIGPAVGALLAALFGLRGAVFAGSVLPLVAATLVLLAVPRDTVAVKRAVNAAGRTARAALPSVRFFTLEFALGLMIYFFAFVMSQVVRNTAPIVIGRIGGESATTGATGVAFTLAGIGSVVGALGVARLLGRPGWLRPSLVLLSAAAALAYAMIGFAGSVALFTLWFALISLAQGAMAPASNTVIAAGVPAARRGTAFGIAGSVQALAFIVGPMGAALFAATSLTLGFLVLAALLAASGAIVYFFLREPDLHDAPKLGAAEPATEPAPAPTTARAQS